MSELKQQPHLPKSRLPTQTYYEKYFDTTYQRAYFYNPITGASLWDTPLDAIIADMTVVTSIEEQQPY